MDSHDLIKKASQYKVGLDDLPTRRSDMDEKKSGLSRDHPKLEPDDDIWISIYTTKPKASLANPFSFLSNFALCPFNNFWEA
jgi:hypothetical protein